MDRLGHLAIALEEVLVPDLPDQHDGDSDQEEADTEDEGDTEAFLHVEVLMEDGEVEVDEGEPRLAPVQFAGSE